jgi:hypothetical protein
MKIAKLLGAAFVAVTLQAAAQQPTDLLRELEDSSRPETQAFFKEEAVRTRVALDRIPGRTSMLERVRTLSLSTVEVTSIAATNTTRIFYLKRSAGELTFSR